MVLRDLNANASRNVGLRSFRYQRFDTSFFLNLRVHSYIWDLVHQTHSANLSATIFDVREQLVSVLFFDHNNNVEFVDLLYKLQITN